MKTIESLIRKVKSFLFDIFEYSRKEEREDLSFVIGIALENSTKNGSIKIRLLKDKYYTLICKADGEIRKDDLITFSEFGKVKNYERGNNNKN